MHFEMHDVFRARNAESRSISAENPTGARGKGATAVPASDGAARELGQGWKVRPCIPIAAGETVTIMDNDGPGIIRHAWFTFDVRFYRDLIVRMYWDGQEHPSVEAPLADFMCNAWAKRQVVTAIPINVNPSGGMNLYFPMPFHKHARITVENNGPSQVKDFFFTINYTLEDLPDDALSFHASWRRTNPLPYAEEYTILDGVEGRGQYVGTFLAWQQNNAGWWGEGEVKMYIDDDRDFPTICGTGTEDYFGGAWGFWRTDFSAPYLGFLQVDKQSEEVGARMTMYRFHVPDPVYFRRNLKVTIQALGWRDGGRFLPLRDDIASVAYWYQSLPSLPLPPLPDRNAREVI